MSNPQSLLRSRRADDSPQLHGEGSPVSLKQVSKPKTMIILNVTNLRKSETGMNKSDPAQNQVVFGSNKGRERYMNKFTKSAQNFNRKNRNVKVSKFSDRTEGRQPEH